MAYLLGLFVFSVVSMLFGLVGGLVYLVYLPFRNRLIKNNKLTKRKSRQINKAYVCTILLISAYCTYDAFFPGKDFYKEEFKTVTLRVIPASAEFIKKSASYPDLHGDYCSSAQIRLTRPDYNKLLKELENDSRISKNGEIIYSEEFTTVLGDKKSRNITHGFTRLIVGEGDHHLYIGFYNDGQTVFVSICVT